MLFTGDIWEGYGPGAFSMAVGGTWREQWFWQRGQPQELMAYGPPQRRGQPKPSASAAFRAASRTAARTCTSSRPCRRSRAATTSGRLFTEFNMPLWSRGLRQAARARRRGALLGLLDERRHQLVEGGPQLPGRRVLAAQRPRCRATCARRRSPSGSTSRAAAAASKRTRSPASRTHAGPLTTFQITSTNVGNPDLTPEIADTITAGIVIQPQDTGLQFSIDWYDIDLADAIGQLGVQGILNECTNSGGASPCVLNTCSATRPRTPSWRCSTRI